VAKPPKPSKPVKAPRVADPPAPSPPTAATAAIPGLRRLLTAASGARLCYGEPVRVAGRTVIPVARVRAAGGAGRGGPGGGALNAEPLGFIDITAEGARFEPVAAATGLTRPTRPAGAGVAAVAAIGLAAGALLRRGRRPRLRALPR
jgi:hypothetical protein